MRAAMAMKARAKKTETCCFDIVSFAQLYIHHLH